MIDISQYLIVAGFFLMVLDIVWSAYCIFFKNALLLKNQGVRFAVTLVLHLCMVASCVLYGYIYSIHFLSPSIGILLFSGSVLSTLSLASFFSQMTGMEERSMELLEAMVGVIEAGDPNLDGHSLHVRNLTMLLYDNLPFRLRIKVHAQSLQYAALLLDVGKLGIPRSIINKSGKLEKNDWDFVRRHPEIGMKVLSPIKNFDTIALWIKYHHERVDGSGYYHLKGDEIPLASRLIAIADTYSAITMDRNYKPSRTYEEAITELKLVAGKQLDPELVEYFCTISLRKIEESTEEVKQKMQRYQEENFR